MNAFGSSSRTKLLTGSEDLQWVAHRAMALSNSRHIGCPDFGISEVLRTPEQQFERFKVGREYNGESWVIKDKSKVITYCDGYNIVSTHQSGEALDFFAYVDGKANYEPVNMYAIATCLMEAASELGVQFEWGGNYQSMFDGAHFNLVKNNHTVTV